MQEKRRKKLITILGARPQFIKASVLSRLIINDNQFDEIIIHTGQHYDKNMSDIFFNEMKIPKPKYNLNIKSQFHGEMTGIMMSEIEKIVFKESPDCILVYGDTNSTLAGALIASKLNIKLVHVESGLRSFNNNMPEEINRIITDRVSNYLFCPTENSVRNLKCEGLDKLTDKNISMVGDIMYDASLYYSSFSKKNHIKDNQKFILCTVHRAENTDEKNKLNTILYSLNKIGKNQKIIFPLHPRTKKRIEEFDKEFENNFTNIEFIKPLGYIDMLEYLEKCQYVITDSGGLQKEAYFMNKLCLTLRDQTEWIELVDNGYNYLCPIDKQEIIKLSSKILSKKIKFSKGLYGNGNTGELILKQLKKIF